MDPKNTENSLEVKVDWNPWKKIETSIWTYKYSKIMKNMLVLNIFSEKTAMYQINSNNCTSEYKFKSHFLDILIVF